MATKNLKGWKDYYRITLYLDRKQDYAVITTAAKLQRVSASHWLMKHALRLADREVRKANKAKAAEAANNGY